MEDFLRFNAWRQNKSNGKSKVFLCSDILYIQLQDHYTTTLESNYYIRRSASTASHRERSWVSKLPPLFILPKSPTSHDFLTSNSNIPSP